MCGRGRRCRFHPVAGAPAVSRRFARPVAVRLSPDGAPARIKWVGGSGAQSLPVLAVAEHWREWIGALDGEPERDVWRVETPAGPCELHHLRAAPDPEGADGSGGGEWILARWED